MKEDTGHVGAEGRRGGYGEGGNGESITTNSISSRYTNVTKSNQRPAFAILVFAAPEASWRRVFDPCTPLLFDLYD